MTHGPRTRTKVCFIGGAGHSGSTLLGMILGSHSLCFYAGEAAKSRFLGDSNRVLRKRVCKLCGAQCPVWGDFEVTENPDLYEQIARRVGAPLVVDSSKDLEWVAGHLARPSESAALPYYIFLHRDGRAVINSRVRKYPNVDAAVHIERWTDQIRRSQAFYEGFDRPKLIVRYEALATDPAGVTQTICDFLGIPFEAEMLAFYRHAHHPLGGNNGTQFLVARHQGLSVDLAAPDARHGCYYENHRAEIQLDLRWETELGPEALRLFERLAGPDNAPFQWDSEHR